MMIACSIHRSISKQAQSYLPALLISRMMASSPEDSRPDHLERTADNTREENTAASKVIKIQDISPTVKKLILEVEDSHFSFKAGQWVDFFIPGVDTVGGYSMCSSPYLLKENSLLELAVKYSTHPPAHWIHTKCKEGSRVLMRAGGDFFLDNSHYKEGQVLLIGGGVGINPLLSMMLYIKDCQTKRQRTPPVTMLYSAKTIDELIFKEEIESITQQCNVRTTFFTTGANSGSARDFVPLKNTRIAVEDIKECIQGKAQTTHCYICGPGPMIDSMEGFLSQQGVPKGNIHYEKWW